jgi:hypothetical protein
MTLFILKDFSYNVHGGHETRQTLIDNLDGTRDGMINPSDGPKGSESRTYPRDGIGDKRELVKIRID